MEVGCPHQGHGCPHLCMRGDLKHHLSMCPYESLKDLLEEKERTIQDLQKAVRTYLQPLLYRERSWGTLNDLPQQPTGRKSGWCANDMYLQV